MNITTRKGHFECDRQQAFITKWLYNIYIVNLHDDVNNVIACDEMNHDFCRLNEWEKLSGITLFNLSWYKEYIPNYE